MQFPAQQIPNPNNKVVHLEPHTFPTYLITLVELQDIHLRSRKVLQNKESHVIIEENIEE